MAHNTMYTMETILWNSPVYLQAITIYFLYDLGKGTYFTWNDDLEHIRQAQTKRVTGL